MPATTLLNTASCHDRQAPPATATGLSRRQLTRLGAAVAIGAFGQMVAVRAGSATPPTASPERSLPGHSALQMFLERTAPVAGFQSRISLGDSVPRLVAAGILNPDRLAEAYANRDADNQAPSHFPMPALPPAAAAKAEPGPERWNALHWPSPQPILLNRDTAAFYLLALWPLGLANRMRANERSPVNGQNLDRLATTANWTLGDAPNGSVYFNRYPIVSLSPEQEALVVRVAETIYRPCCDNSTFAQDCNHGSAMLGLLQLGVTQGLDERELYQEALMFNAYWFMETYAKTALYFKLFQALDWAEVEPEIATSYPYSALGPWRINVESRIAKVPDLLPLVGGQAGCSI